MGYLQRWNKTRWGQIVHTYIHMYTYIYIYIRIDIYTYIYGLPAKMEQEKVGSNCTYIYTYICTHRYICIYTFTYRYILWGNVWCHTCPDWCMPCQSFRWAMSCHTYECVTHTACCWARWASRKDEPRWGKILGVNESRHTFRGGVMSCHTCEWVMSYHIWMRSHTAYGWARWVVPCCMRTSQLHVTDSFSRTHSHTNSMHSQNTTLLTQWWTKRRWGQIMCVYIYIYSNVHVHRYILGVRESHHKCQCWGV